MTASLALTFAIVIAGQTEKKSKVDEVDPHAGSTVYFGGRTGYKAEGNREPLTITIISTGEIVERGIIEVTDQMLKKWLTKYCEGHATVVIAVGVEEPDKTSLSTISKTIEKIKKHLPSKTKVTFWILDRGS